MRSLLLAFAFVVPVQAQFPLPLPARQITFPLTRPSTAGLAVVWGGNGQGQSVPQPSLTNAVQVVASADSSFALRSNGTVAAWGGNSFGQTTLPVGLSNVVQIAAGGYHALALRQDGTVAGWGANYAGQTTIPASLSNVVQLAAGETHSLALKADGTVFAWGGNSLGQATVPGNLSNVVAVAAGAYVSLALKSDGTVSAWGNNASGQISLPAGLTNIVQVAVGETHCLALRNNGQTVAWGEGASTYNAPPASLTQAIRVSAGSYYSVAAKADGTVIAWGYAGQGQDFVPVGLSGVAGLSAGAGHVGALVQMSESARPIVLADSASLYAFDEQLVGATASRRSFAVQNTGLASLQSPSLSLAGTNALDFTLSASTLSSLAPGAVGGFDVFFGPSGGGSKSARVDVNSASTGNGPLSLTLQGYAIGTDSDSDGDGLNDAAEYGMSALGFNWRESQPNLVLNYYSNASRAGLYNKAQVAANPELFGLYDTTSIMDLALGGLMIQKTGSTVDLDLQIQTSADIVNQPFTNNGPPITRQVTMPGSKGFLRIQSIRK